MKTRLVFLIALSALLFTSGYSQEKTKRELKEEKKIEQQNKIDSLVNSREFVFIARQAVPLGMRTVDLTTNTNYVKFKPDMIESYMPFFGRGYSGIGYGSDTGLKFEGRPEKFTIVKSIKNFQIDVVVNNQTDNFVLSLTVYSDGNASLSINSNNRSPISYHGEISSIQTNN
jgi:hypothetical protein